MPLKREGVNQHRFPSRSQCRGRNVAKSGHITNSSRGKANAVGKKVRAKGRKKSKASSPAPFPVHMERDLNGKPARRNRRNGQYGTTNRPTERNKQRQTKKAGKQGVIKKSKQNRTQQSASGRDDIQKGNGNDARPQ